MKAATVEELKAARTRFWIAIVATFIVVQFVNFVTDQQEGWKTVVVGVLAIFALLYLISVIWLAVDCSRRLKELGAVAGAGAARP